MERLEGIQIDLHRGLACAAHRSLVPLLGSPDDFAEVVAPDCRGSRERTAASAYPLAVQEELPGEIVQIGLRRCLAGAAYPPLALLRVPSRDLVAASAPQCCRLEPSPVRTGALASQLIVREEILGEILQIGRSRRCSLRCVSRPS